VWWSVAAALALEPVDAEALRRPGQWLGGGWTALAADAPDRDVRVALRDVWPGMRRFGASRYTGADTRAELHRTDAACALAVAESATSAESQARVVFGAVQSQVDPNREEDAPWETDTGPTVVPVVVRRMRWTDGPRCSWEIDVLVAAAARW
jgi:hypothetical protein